MSREQGRIANAAVTVEYVPPRKTTNRRPDLPPFIIGHSVVGHCAVNGTGEIPEYVRDPVPAVAADGGAL